MENDHDLQVGIEGSHRSNGLVSVKKTLEWVVSRAHGRGVVERDLANLAATPELIAADIDEDPIEPGLETGGVAQETGRSPGPQQRLLCRVLRFLPIAEDQAG